MNSIAAKLIKVRTECSSVTDALGTVNVVLGNHNLAAIALPELLDYRDVVSEGKNEYLVTVRTTITVIDAETGESLQVAGLGSGQGQAEQALVTAQTASMRYAYTMGLGIVSGAQKENETPVAQRTPPSEGKNNAQAEKAKTGQSCSDCGASITPGVQRVSVSKYRRPLCMACQRKKKSA